MKAPIFLIAGPTASGKTAIAVEVASRCNAEIISADAFQIYRGMPILTAQPSAQELGRAPHHLIGQLALKAAFDVGKFLCAAQECAAQIAARGRLALVVGGTGLYCRALTHGLADLPPADPVLRASLDALSTQALQQQLCALDPIAAKTVDLQNRRRLIRALEVCTLTGQPFSAFRQQTQPSAEIHGVCLVRSREELYARINARTRQMFENGVLEEVRTLQDLGPTASQALGLKECRACLEGELGVEAAIDIVQRATRNYAKRQITWFRREPNLRPLDLSTMRTEQAVHAIVELVKKAGCIADQQLPCDHPGQIPD